MTEVGCSRCGSTAKELERAPLPGELGRTVKDRICAACWKEWLRAQVMLINENQLSPANPEHYERLVSEMKTFLNLVDTE